MLFECQKQDEVIYYLLNCRMVCENPCVLIENLHILFHLFWFIRFDLSDQLRSQDFNVRGSLASAAARAYNGSGTQTQPQTQNSES
jgi:hypothetical protein